MFSPLPDLVDPRRAADSRAVFAGRLQLSSLPRLRDLLLDGTGDATFRLVFCHDSDGRPVVTGEVCACLILRCQRCLEALEYPIEAPIELAVVTGVDEVDRLPDTCDPVLMPIPLIRPRDLIEDELLLGLPQIPRHEPGACSTQDEGLLSPMQEKTDDQGHPFAILASLKRERSH